MCILTDKIKGELDISEVKKIKMAKGATKTNNKDKRREKSKIAARCRRGKESEIFEDLAESIPVTNTIRESLDKASIVRLTICDLKLQKLVARNSTATAVVNGEASSLPTIQSEIEAAESLGKAVGGFFIIIAANGDITYVSENISDTLGLTQCEVMGKSIYEFSHPCDLQDVKNLIFLGKGQELVTNRSALFRLKCTLTSRGTSVHIRAATDKVIHFNGRMFNDQVEGESYFIGIGESIPYPSDAEIPFKHQIFQSTHSQDMKCLSVDKSVGKFLGYDVDDIIGKSLFAYQHAGDNSNFASLVKALYVKGQIRSERYRFLAKNGGWVWMITEATLIKPSKGTEPNTVGCRHIVLSDVESREEVLSDVQLATTTATTTTQPAKVDFNRNRVIPSGEISPAEKNLLPLPLILNEVVGVSNPIPSTAKIFAPRTDDMDTGFLMPFDCDKKLTKVSEEVDLTHLAPIAGDECVPLNSELFEDFLKFIDSTDPDYPIDDSIINLDQLDFLNSTIEGTNFVPIEELCEKYLPGFDSSLSSPLMQETDPVLSTINLTPYIAPTKQPTIEYADELGQNGLQQLDPNYFDTSDADACMDFLSCLPDALSTNMNMALDTSLNPFDRAKGTEPAHTCPPPIPRNTNRNNTTTNTTTTRPKLCFADIERALLKRKTDGNIPKVVTSSIFTDLIPPNKYPKLTTNSSLMAASTNNSADFPSIDGDLDNLDMILGM